MPRRKMIKPTLHKPAGRKHYDRYVKVKYERVGKRKIFEMDIPAIGEITINSVLEPLIAQKLGCDSADIFLIDKDVFEPYMVVNPRVDDEKV